MRQNNVSKLTENPIFADVALCSVAEDTLWLLPLCLALIIARVIDDCGHCLLPLLF